MKPFDKFRILESSDPTVDKCVLFGPFSYIVQSFLAFLSFTVLICKHTNNPQLNDIEKIQEDHGKYGSLMYQNKYVVLVLNIF